MAATKLAADRRSYHSSTNGWRRAGNLIGKAIGIELELEGNETYVEVLTALPEHDVEVDGPQPHFETDNSLDYSRGVEIIFPPYSPAAIRTGQAYVAKAMRALDEADVVQVSTRCGMHMNVNINGWSDHRRAVFVGVIHNMPVDALEKLGGRRLNRYCSQFRNSNLSTYITRPADGHTHAAEHKAGGGRVELRFPGATTVLEDMSRIAAFIDLLDDYAEAMPENWNAAPSAHYEHFLEALRISVDGDANDLYTFLNTP